MRYTLLVAAVTIVACSRERMPSMDSSALDSSAAAVAADSGAASARDTQPPQKTKASARSSTSATSRTTGTSGSSKTPITVDTELYPADTFGIRPRDTTLENILKKRPPEVRRPQDPQKTP